MSNWIVDAHVLDSNPYDGHTLEGAIAQIERLTKKTPDNVIIDQGYQGHGSRGASDVITSRLAGATL